MMSKMKKIIGVIVMCVMLVGFESTAVHASEVSLYYVNASSCMVRLSYNNNTAKCTVSVTGKSGTSSISGTLELYDVTDGKSIKKWTISKTGSLYSSSKSKKVTVGHKYRLKFTGNVYDKNNVAEEQLKDIAQMALVQQHSRY